MDGTKVRAVIKSIISAYIITGILLLLTAFLLYKMEPEQSLVSIGILVIYVLSCFLGGLIAGKSIKSRKFFWGMITGMLYFMLLLGASWITGGGIHSAAGQIVTTLLLCIGGGMLGGMLA